MTWYCPERRAWSRELDDCAVQLEIRLNDTFTPTNANGGFEASKAASIRSHFSGVMVSAAMREASPRERFASVDFPCVLRAEADHRPAAIGREHDETLVRQLLKGRSDVPRLNPR